MNALTGFEAGDDQMFAKPRHASEELLLCLIVGSHEVSFNVVPCFIVLAVSGWLMERICLSILAEKNNRVSQESFSDDRGSDMVVKFADNACPVY